MPGLDTIDPDRFADSASQAAGLLRALANERRLMILCRLADGERTVGELQALLGLSQSALSQHLAVLRRDAILATRRQGQAIHYRIADPAAVRLVTTLAEIFCPSHPTPVPGAFS